MVDNLNDFFRNTSLYSVLDQDPPECFLQVERQVAPLLGSKVEAFTYRPMVLATNLCQRSANVALYVSEIADLSRDLSLGGHLKLETRLIGYFGSCKSLLDAAAIALSESVPIFDKVAGDLVPLPEKKQDFANKHFWNLLRDNHSQVHDRYSPLRETMDEIIGWRHSAVHRFTPRVTASFARDRSTNTLSFLGYSTDEPDPTVPGKRADPLHFHRLWESTLITLCTEVCQDILNAGPIQ